MNNKRPEEIEITIKLVNKPNTIGMGWADTEQPISSTSAKTGKKKQIGKVSATIGCSLRVELEKYRNKEYSVYCISSLDIWDAVQVALKEKNLISK